MGNNIMETVEKYYSEKINKHGRTSEGVDWKDEEGQILRMKQFEKLFEENRKFSLNDLGCGYGKLAEYLDNKGYNFDYNGYDISEEMIKNAKEYCKNIKNKNIEFYKIDNVSEMKIADYIVTSGIFNVKFNYEEKIWEEYIMRTIEEMNKKSKYGFAFNVLTSYSDKEFRKNNLYYANPLYYFDYCKKNFSKNVSLIHDYNLYEFTIIVKK